MPYAHKDVVCVLCCLCACKINTTLHLGFKIMTELGCANGCRVAT